MYKQDCNTIRSNFVNHAVEEQLVSYLATPPTSKYRSPKAQTLLLSYKIYKAKDGTSC